MGQMKRQLGDRPAGQYAVPLDRIIDGLAARAGELCRELLPRGVNDRGLWSLGSIDNEPGSSCKVWLNGPRQGQWFDFATGEFGDMLNLVARRRFGGHMGDAVKWALSWLGLDGKDPNRLKTTERAVAKREAKDADREDEERKRRNGAFHIFLSAQEKIAGTPVEAYLRGRGIDLALLGRQPRAIRFHPGLWNAEAGAKFAAMVAAIVNHEGDFLAVHRTWLAQRPDGLWGKAALRDPKMTYGSYAGGAIHLWRGAGGKRLNQAPEGSTLDVTEGIEDALSVAVACPDARIWAAVSLANVKNLVLPPAIAAVRIWAQNDAPDSKAAQALDKAIGVLLAQGKRVLIARPPQGVKDVNDVVRGEG